MLKVRKAFRTLAQRTAMVEKLITSPKKAQGPAQEKTAQETGPRNVVSLSLYRERNGLASAMPLSSRTCRHCGAVLFEGEREEECSSTSNVDEARLRWRAAQILRALV
jgi:hypothetical protein